MAARSKLCSSVSAWLGVFACIAVIGVVGVGNNTSISKFETNLLTNKCKFHI